MSDTGTPSQDYAMQSLPSGKIKATWLWDTSLISKLSGRNAVIQFAKKQQITRIYMQVNPSVAINAYRAFIRTASASGIQIHALDGAPDWVMPNRHINISSLVNWVMTYNNSVAEDERFSGIQVDIEPYLLPEWFQDRDTTVANWLDALVLFAGEAAQYPSLTIGSALPFWLDEIIVPATGETMIEAVLQHMHEVTLMSYRDQAQAVVDITHTKLSLADALGKKIFVALETNPTSEGLFITFYDEGRIALEAQMAEIDRLLGIYPSYSGIVVHDYVGWQNLKP